MATDTVTTLLSNRDINVIEAPPLHCQIISRVAHRSPSFRVRVTDSALGFVPFRGKALLTRSKRRHFAMARSMRCILFPGPLMTLKLHTKLVLRGVDWCLPTRVVLQMLDCFLVGWCELVLIVYFVCRRSSNVILRGLYGVVILCCSLVALRRVFFFSPWLTRGYFLRFRYFAITLVG